MIDDPIFPIIVVSTTVVPIGAFWTGLVSYQQLPALVLVAFSIGLVALGGLKIVAGVRT